MSTRIRRLALASTLAALAWPVLAAQQPKTKGQPAPEAMTGVKVGEKAPAFTLKDQDGAERSLDGLLKAGNLALVFTRSADW